MIKNTDSFTRFYRVPEWGDGFFDIDNAGRVIVFLGESKTPIPLLDVIDRALLEKLKLPLLLRFPHILHERTQKLIAAFNEAISKHHYLGRYFPVYPIKVNQQKSVIDQLLLPSQFELGLEAGSKAELLAILALPVSQQKPLVICNGYKDEAFIKMAFVGKQMGHNTVIVIEKMFELPLILSLLETCETPPILGIRVRLGSVGKGAWQNTGGEKSKFGLSTAEVLKVTSVLSTQKLCHHLSFLHCHLGSQISDLADLKQGLLECARFYRELHALGVSIKMVDVGGGLSVDYTGTHDTHYYSMNYCFSDYADSIVTAFKEICSQYQLPHPHLVTEAGRAMTAHHAVLVTNVLHQEKPFSDTKNPLPVSHPLEKRLESLLASLSHHNAEEVFSLTKQTLVEGLALYTEGSLSLPEKASLENTAYQIYQCLYQDINLATQSYSLFEKELLEKIAYKWVCNFSIFQSIPDVWGIDQIFPILPLTGLMGESLWPVVIADITCDSDGRIDHYVSTYKHDNTLLLPAHAIENENQTVGFFLVGAYQEILGDMHNLFGDTTSVQVLTAGENKFSLQAPLPGDSISQILSKVHFDPNQILDSLETQFLAAGFTQSAQTKWRLFFEEVLKNPAYLVS